MKLRLLSEESSDNLLEDPRWFMDTITRLAIPVDYQLAKDRIKQEVDSIGGFGNDDRSMNNIFEAIQKSWLCARINVEDYQQYFQKPVGEFHADDEFGGGFGTNKRVIKVNDKSIIVTLRMNYGDTDRITGEGTFPKDIVATLQKTYTDNKLIILQALDSYLRDNGSSIREKFGLRIPVHGM
jgi:hypothetical protein